ncbi:splicing factor, partial [Basidiobolus ranarum]
MDYARSLLSELMSPYESESKKKFFDRDVCKYFLVRFCPHELFINTKSDLGPCDKIHEEALKRDYQEAEDREKYGYEEEFYEYLQTLINDLDRKIRKGKERLNIQPDESLLNPNKDEKEEKIVLLDEKIKSLLAQIEEAGEEGRVQEAQDLNQQLERLQAELATLKNNDDSNPIFKQEKRMEVCDVCGSFLVTNDTSKRLDAHMEGKQHTGYAKIREALEEYVKKYGEKPRDRGGRRESRDRNRYRDRDRDSRRYDRDRYADRDYRRRDRDGFERRRSGDRDYHRE